MDIIHFAHTSSLLNLTSLFQSTFFILYEFRLELCRQICKLNRSAIATSLTWLGRGEWSIEDWDEIESEIKDVREQQTSEYLIGNPLLSDFLEEGLAQFGLTSDQGR